MLTGVEFSQLEQQQIERLGYALNAVSTIKHAPSDEELVSVLVTEGLVASPRQTSIQTTLFKTSAAYIGGMSGCLPSRVVVNGEIVEEKPEIFDQIVRRALGAVERRAAAVDESNAVMLTRVARDILRDAELDPLKLSRIICSSDPQDRVAPNVASIVQSMIGAQCPAYDIQMSCAGWVCGIENALRCIEAGEDNILVLASSLVGSRLTFFNRRDRAIFGDGASGVLIKYVGLGHSAGKIMCTELWTDGKFHNEIVAPLPWSQRPSNIPKEYEGSFYMCPDQDIFFETLTRVLPTFFSRLLELARWDVQDIDHFLLHQPTMPLFHHSLRVLNQIPREKVFDFFAQYGNLVSAEMPMMLSHGVRSGRIRPSDKVLILTYGAGFTMAGWLFEY